MKLKKAENPLSHWFLNGDNMSREKSGAGVDLFIYLLIIIYYVFFFPWNLNI